MEEYFHQSDKEKKDSLPVAPFMDRDRVTKPSAQIGFIKYVLLPIFEALSKVIILRKSKKKQWNMSFIL